MDFQTVIFLLAAFLGGILFSFVYHLQNMGNVEQLGYLRGYSTGYQAASDEITGPDDRIKSLSEDFAKLSFSVRENICVDCMTRMSHIGLKSEFKSQTIQNS